MWYISIILCIIVYMHFVAALPRHHTSATVQQLNAALKHESHHINETAEREYYHSLQLPEYWMPTILDNNQLLIENMLIDVDSSAKHTARHRHTSDNTTRTRKNNSTTDDQHTAHTTSAPVTISSKPSPTPKPTQPKPIEVRNNRIYVNGQPMNVQGICYSPVPIGESVNWPPMGDYFTPDYAYIWQRDLPMIRAMGATVIRIYGWNNAHDHRLFLDACDSVGLKVLVTYYLGDAKQTPVWTVEQRNYHIQMFVEQVDMYKDHPAILMWSFGNELNGWWNGFMTDLSKATGCWWQAGCAGYQDTNSDCHWQAACVYYQLFHWINSACKAAKVVAPDKPCISGMADVDFMVGPTPWLDKVARFNWILPDVDAWAIQLYRGYTFGGYFGMYRGESQKPMIVTEYGVDAYNDPCGWPENNYGGCRNTAGDGHGGDVAINGGFWGCAAGGECSKPGVQTQMEWDMRLTSEIMGNYMDYGGIVWGGFLMAWTDEYWKGVGTQDFCQNPCPDWNAEWCKNGGFEAYKPGGSAGCTFKAHFTCSNYNTQYHDLCGYFLAAAPDNYVNEEWFGITAPIPCGRHDIDGGHRLDSLYVRPAYLGIQQLWTGTQEVDTKFLTCESLEPCWHCSTSHPIEDLQAGACKEICKLKMPAIGWGSPHASDNVVQGHRLPPNATFTQKFGLPIILGASLITLALIALSVVFIQHMRRQMSSSAGENERLVARSQ